MRIARTASTRRPIGRAGPSSIFRERRSRLEITRSSTRARARARDASRRDALRVVAMRRETAGLSATVHLAAPRYHHLVVIAIANEARTSLLAEIHPA